jgi:hypothetical protein
MEYPSRPPYFAHRYLRLLAKSASAQDLGPSVCWLLAVIAIQEDAKRYTEPAKYYLDQLTPICGFQSKQTLTTAITKACAGGWLHYAAGGKGRPGRFMVTIPAQFLELEDSPCDESDDVCIPKIGTQNKDAFQKLERNRNGSLTQPERKGIASIPIPIPTPSKKRPQFQKPTLEQVKAYCDARRNAVNPEQFFDHYEANGWVQGKGKSIRDWEAAVRTWERNGIQSASAKTPKSDDVDYPDATAERLAKQRAAQ